jgi:hypothetical protein
VLAQGARVTYRTTLIGEIRPLGKESAVRWWIEWSPGHKLADSDATGGMYERTWDDIGEFDVVCEYEGRTGRYRQVIVPIEDFAQRSLASVRPTTMEDARLTAHTTLDLATLKWRNGRSEVGAEIRSDAPNPAPCAQIPNGKMATFTIDALPRDARVEHLYWYLTTPDRALMALRNYGGMDRVSLDGAPAFFVNSGAQAGFTFYDKTFSDIVCVESATDQPPHDGGATRRCIARYTQMVLGDEQVEAVHRLRKQAVRDDALLKRIPEGRGEPLRAVYVRTEDSARVPLSLFVGPDAEHPGKSVVVDMTPGASRSTFAGESTEDAVKAFIDENDYPPGVIELEVPNALVGAVDRRMIKTHGRSKSAREAKEYAKTGGAISSAGALTAALGFSGPAGWLFLLASLPLMRAAVLGVEDQLAKDDPDWRLISIDLLQLAGAFLGDALEIQAMRGVTIAARQYTVVGRLGVKFAPMLLVQKDYFHQWLEVRNSDLPAEEKHKALAMVAYAQLKLGIAIVLERRAATLGRATNFDSQGWSAFTLGTQLFMPFGAASAAVRPNQKTTSGEGHHEPVADLTDPDPMQLGAHGVVASESASTPCGIPPDLKAAQYRLMGPPRSGRRQWYALCESDKNMALDQYGYHREPIPDALAGVRVAGAAIAGRCAYNLGTDESPWWSLMEPNLYVIVCIELDEHGHPLEGPVRYFVQRVTSRASDGAIGKLLDGAAQDGEEMLAKAASWAKGVHFRRTEVDEALKHPLAAHTAYPLRAIAYRLADHVNATELKAAGHPSLVNLAFGNAVKHCFWQSALASRVGGARARALGDAHEHDPSIIEGVDVRSLVFDGRNGHDEMAQESGDTRVDLLNNGIGRIIGCANRGASLTTLAEKVAEHFVNEGLWAVFAGPDHRYTVNMFRLATESLPKLLTVIRAANLDG